MAPPPSYSDLGKQARDVFGKGYHFGLWKLDCKTKTESGVEFSTSGNSNQETGKVAGSLETKYKVNDYGLTLSEKWTTDNTLFTEISHTDKLLKGLKLTFEGSFAPHTGTKSGKIKASYGQDLVKIDSDVNVNLAGPVIQCIRCRWLRRMVGWVSNRIRYSKNQIGHEQLCRRLCVQGIRCSYQCQRWSRVRWICLP
ncbi:hypothetical protein HA402_015020 [Bradysia odoriphaga]|nr:hypothetical protein HA402_015020 [Bradysia odoriphaga]